MSGPKRIVCLTEETTEALYLMGEENRIVGISAFTVRPERAKTEKPVVSQFIRAKIDDIAALDPDLVLAFSDLQADIVRDLVKAGLEVHAFNQRSVAGILAMIRLLGRLIDREEKGESLASRLEANLDAVRKRAAARSTRPRVYFEEWPDPIITGIRWVSELIEIAGGEDVFADFRDRSLAKDRQATPAEVIGRKPDLYIACWCGKKFREKEALARAGFAEAPFTRPGRMIEIDPSIILQPGPAALTDGVLALEQEIARVAADLDAAASH
ncbi:MAG TPA: cobalamin-binding protein [Planctomycetes bacterium]|nr:cobalamin-binding protein [Planctomycetota bacterium]